MTLKLFLMVITCVLLGAAAQLVMKMGMSSAPVQSALAGGLNGGVALAIARSPLVIAGLAAYFVGAALWLIVLSKADLSLVFPFTGLGFVLTMLFGWWFLGEDVGVTRVAGTLLIAFGAFLVARS